MLEADLAILDEIDSGLDIDALRDVAEAVNGLRREHNAVLLITHYQRLLDYITPDFVHIMVSGHPGWATKEKDKVGLEGPGRLLQAVKRSLTYGTSCFGMNAHHV